VVNGVKHESRAKPISTWAFVVQSPFGMAHIGSHGGVSQQA